MEIKFDQTSCRYLKKLTDQVQQKELTVTDMVFKLLDFTGAPYSWYIEMYLGLFLLIPFLNILYNNLASQRHKQILVITFVICIAGSNTT